jgi:hypothetical protein
VPVLPVSLADRIADAPEETLKVEGSRNELAFSGLVSTNPLHPGDGGAFAKIFELAGLSQADYRLDQDTFRFSTWQTSSRSKAGDRDLVQLFSYQGKFVRLTPADLDADHAADLLRLAKRNKRKVKPAPDRTRVVVISDPQVGKVDHRGGTPELLARIAWLRDRLDETMADQPCSEAVLLDAGDLIEGFENTASQNHMNDLSLPSMLRVSRSILTDLIGTVAARHASTRVATVPSNHAAWRRGSGYLGAPGDDFGIDCHRAVSDVFARDPNLNVTWEWPDRWSPSLALDIAGARVGLTHGDHAKQRQFKSWLAGQALGSTVLADCNIVISGHYHGLLLEPVGFLGTRERTHIQAPTMDNGSEWWLDLTGDDSAPGIVTFMITDGHIDSFKLIAYDA